MLMYFSLSVFSRKFCAIRLTLDELGVELMTKRPEGLRVRPHTGSQSV